MREDRPPAAALPVQVHLEAQAGVSLAVTAGDRPAVIAAVEALIRQVQAPVAQVATLAAAPQVLVRVATLAVALGALTLADIPVAAPRALIRQGQQVPATLAGIPASGRRERTQMGLSPLRIPVQAVRPRVRRKARRSPM